MKEFTNIKHKDASAMNGLSFFLGTSNPAAFHGINGYFYNARVHTFNGAYKGSASDVENYYNSIVRPPMLTPGHMLVDVIPGDSVIDTLNCG